MASTDPGPAFTTLQKRLHWTVVGLLLLQFYVFDHLGRPFRRLIETGAGDYNFTVVAHIAIGTTVLVLAAWRLGLRVLHTAPPPPAAEPELAKRASKWAHAALYLLLFALPLLGLGAWFLPSRTLGELHEIGSNLLLILSFAHVGAVAVHQFWWQTGLLRRMI